MKKENKDKIMEWHKLVVGGLVNGLSHVNRDKRLEDIDFWRSRSYLFNEFAHCVLDLITKQNYECAEENLKKIANEGYKNLEKASWQKKMNKNLDYLLIQDLKIGEKFIALPVPGDNHGHGGYKGAHYLHEKISSTKYRRCKDGIISHLPESMLIIKVE